MDITILGPKPEIFATLARADLWDFARVGRELGLGLDVPRGAGEDAATHTSCRVLPGPAAAGLTLSV